MDKRTTVPCVLQNFVPFGAAAQKSNKIWHRGYDVIRSECSGEASRKVIFHWLALLRMAIIKDDLLHDGRFMGTPLTITEMGARLPGHSPGLETKRRAV